MTRAIARWLDPHMTDMYAIDAMLDDFISALGRWLPRFTCNCK
jgi:alpha-galactosidase/6-phospho-beta-glucosidase family protein